MNITIGIILALITFISESIGILISILIGKKIFKFRNISFKSIIISSSIIIIITLILIFESINKIFFYV